MSDDRTSPAWLAPLQALLHGQQQLLLAAEATTNASLPKALRLLREGGLAIEGSCSLYPLGNAPLADVLQALLAKDLAHGTPVLPPEQVAHIANTIIANLPADTSILSNAHWAHDTGGWHPASWMPFTAHTFDAGIIWLAPASVGALWAWAED